MNYQEFLQKKQFQPANVGFEIDESELNPNLFDWQKVIVRWALRKGRCALFEDCGLGKTIQFLAWADIIHKKTGLDVLIFSPLGASHQTVREGQRFRITVKHCKEQSDARPGINITNYERIDKFDPYAFGAVVLDESSIIKNFSGVFRNSLIEAYRTIPYKLCCSATPSPNSYQELGNQAEFLNVMTMAEMLSMFFINDTNDTTASWRLKGHVKNNAFWKWLSTWCVMIQKPSDIGFSDEGYDLPPLNYIVHEIPYTGPRVTLFTEPAKTLSDIRESSKETMDERVKKSAEIVDDSVFAVWCSLNEESKKLTESMQGVEVCGADSPEYKEKTFIDFADDKIRRMIVKPKIAMYGMNWQNCHNTIITGLTHSYEQFYQLIRRFWRFGQKHTVNVHVVIGEREKEVLNTVIRKEQEMTAMFQNMVKHMQLLMKAEIQSGYKVSEEYNPQVEMRLPDFLEVA